MFFLYQKCLFTMSLYIYSKYILSRGKHWAINCELNGYSIGPADFACIDCLSLSLSFPYFTIRAVAFYFFIRPHCQHSTRARIILRDNSYHCGCFVDLLFPLDVYLVYYVFVPIDSTSKSVDNDYQIIFIHTPHSTNVGSNRWHYAFAGINSSARCQSRLCARIVSIHSDWDAHWRPWKRVHETDRMTITIIINPLPAVSLLNVSANTNNTK